MLDRKACGFITNNDPSSEPGTLGGFLLPNRKKAEFSVVMVIRQNIIKIHLQTFCITIPTNGNLTLVNWSDVCGQYCIFYLNHRVQGHSMNNIVHSFSNDTMLNDVRVSQLVRKHFKVSLSKRNVNSIQSSKKLAQK